MKQEPVEEIIIPVEERDEILNDLRQVLLQTWTLSNILAIKRVNCVKVCDKEWMKLNDFSNGQYSVNKNISLKTSTLRSDLCGDSNAYIVVKGTIDLLGDDAKENNKAEDKVASESNDPFKPCISKINSTLIDSSEDLDTAIIILWH